MKLLLGIALCLLWASWACCRIATAPVLDRKGTDVCIARQTRRDVRSSSAIWLPEPRHMRVPRPAALVAASHPRESLRLTQTTAAQTCRFMGTRIGITVRLAGAARRIPRLVPVA